MWSQDHLIFPTHAVAPPGSLPDAAEKISFETPDGQQLHGVHIPPARQAKGGPTLVLGFGGNAWNGQDVALYLHDIFPDAHVVAFHYRGYRPSTGAPSAKALIEDAPRVYDFATRLVGSKRVVAAGFSIGSGVAASLVGRRQLDGLILVTPFDSLKAVAGDLYPWLPMGLMFQHELHSAQFLAKSDIPVAIIAAEHDEIIPTRRTQALRKVVANLVFDRTIAGSGHNDIYGRADFRTAMAEALEAVVSG